MNTLVIEEALSTWVPPTIAVLLLGIVLMLDALGMFSEQGAALVAMVSLLILGAFAVFGPLLRDRTPLGALLTATATGAGLRQVFGSAFVGGIGGVPAVGIVAWLARRSPWIRAITSRHTT